jgi:DNA repair exonuclease SbcCD ATPase subunit
LFDHTLVAERDEARTRLLKSEEDCKRLIAERDEARRERDSYMVQAHKIASDRDMLRDQTDDILDYQQQIADLTRERDEAREDWRVAQVNLQHASATRRHSAFAMSEWLRDAVEVGLLLRACYGPEQPNSIARLDALIAEWRAAADDFASRND